MPSFTNPNDDAEEARESLRGLAHATRCVDDPTEIYPVLGSITHGLASLARAFISSEPSTTVPLSSAPG